MIWHEKQSLDAEFYSHLPDARGGPCMAMPAGLMEGRLAINVLASMEKQIGRAYGIWDMDGIWMDMGVP